MQWKFCFYILLYAFWSNRVLLDGFIFSDPFRSAADFARILFSCRVLCTGASVPQSSFGLPGPLSSALLWPPDLNLFPVEIFPAKWLLVFLFLRRVCRPSARSSIREDFPIVCIQFSWLDSSVAASRFLD
jgi:hypothetical protein